MIVDSLKNWKSYQGIHDDFDKVFAIFEQIATGTIKGKTVIEEGNVWVNAPAVVVETDAEKLYEAHRDFIDIHYIASGKEQFGVINIEDLSVVKEYDQAGDYSLLSGDVECVTLKKGDFCVVFPQDAHIPAYHKVGNEELVRVVAKIRCKINK